MSTRVEKIPLEPTNTTQTLIQRTDCCSALLNLRFKVRKGHLTQEEIQTQKIFLLSHIPKSQTCKSCIKAFTEKQSQEATRNQ